MMTKKKEKLNKMLQIAENNEFEKGQTEFVKIALERFLLNKRYKNQPKLLSKRKIL